MGKAHLPKDTRREGEAGMTFWSTQTIRNRAKPLELFDPYESTAVRHAAYELAMGPEAFITSTEGRRKTQLKEKEALVVPTGQFAILLTEERVKIPDDAIGFISMRFKVKKQGLVNVSGFHVDPGFAGRLKFSVYNAGPGDITITRGDRIFMLWLADLDETCEDPYGDAGPDQDVINSGDQNVMQGNVASPGQLRKDVDRLEHLYSAHKGYLTLLIGILGALFVRLIFLPWALPWSSQLSEEQIESIKRKVVQEMRDEMPAIGGPLSEPSGTANKEDQSAAVDSQKSPLQPAQ
jgi:dCTP deaminase